MFVARGFALMMLLGACTGRDGFKSVADDATRCPAVPCAWGTWCDDGSCVAFTSGTPVVPHAVSDFADGGVLIYDAGASDNIDRFALRPLAIDSAGRLVLAGEVLVGGYNQALVARFLASGSLDVTFGDGGEARVDMGSEALAQSLLLDAQDDIYAGLSRTNTAARGILKLLSSGAVDSTWGVAGYAAAASGDFVSDGLYRRDDGRYFLTGQALSTANGWDLSASMFAADGAALTGLATNGTAHSPYASDEFGSALTFVAGGFVLGGQAFAADGFDFIVVKLTDDGVVDTTFGTNGYTLQSITAGRDGIQRLLTLPDGRIVGAGATLPRGDSGDLDVAMAAFTSAGALDTSFAAQGLFTYDGDGGDDELVDLIMFDDQRFLAAGQRTTGGNSNVLLAMFTLAGELEASFGNGGLFEIDLGSSVDLGLALLPGPDGSLFVAGMTSNGNDADIAVVKLRFEAQ